MKKFLTVLACILTALPFAAFCACGKTDDNAVHLVAIEGAQVGVTDNIDYFVVPEPAVSTKVNAIQGLEFVGDLQQLYGGTNGYPQAVVVAKAELAETSFMSEFINTLGRNGQWLSNESTSADKIVNAVQSHLTEGMSPTFTAKNLTKDVIKNCGINFVSATESKAEIISFMQKLNSVSGTSFGTPSDSFFLSEQGTQEYSGNISVYAPDGAPALGLANLLAGEENFSDGVNVNYEIVDATTIQTYVGGGKADICVLPVNLAVKLLGSGEKYKLVGTLTHGNLYIVSKNGEKITTDNLGILKGKKVGVVNLAAVPGLTFKLILKENNVEFKEVV